MGRYKPGTMDDFDVAARRLSRTEQRLRQANTPSRTQTYQTTVKIESTGVRFDGITAKAEAAEKKAEESAAQAAQATSKAEAADEKADDAAGKAAATLALASNARTFTASASLDAVKTDWTQAATISVPAVSDAVPLLSIAVVGMLHASDLLMARLMVGERTAATVACPLSGTTALTSGTLDDARTVILSAHADGASDGATQIKLMLRGEGVHVEQDDSVTVSALAVWRGKDGA